MDKNTLIAIRELVLASGCKQVRAGEDFVDVSFRTDRELQDFAAQFGVKTRTATVGDKCWDALEAYMGDIPVYADGPHRNVEERAA